MTKIYYIGHVAEGFNDGGQSRNKAFMHSFATKDALILPIYSANVFIRLYYWINAVKFMLFSKKNEIFIHQGTLVVLFPFPVLKLELLRKLVFRLIERTNSRNDVTIEVNDLPYEQSKDLELTVQEIDRVFQDNLYQLKNAKYVFASHEMGKFVHKKFNVNYKVVINGSSNLKDFSDDRILPDCFNSNETKFIYAGGLNKGRQIELLITKFSGKKEVLILIGEWGGWLSEYELPSNVFYLGKFKEDYAHYLTSKCDVGLIPYDENRFYYNICYPTKASFYITAGIPFLSTPLLELKNVFEDRKMVYFVPFNDWDKFITDFDKSNLVGIKEIINNEKHAFYWKELLDQYWES
jgi:hypothetical protein